MGSTIVSRICAMLGMACLAAMAVPTLAQTAQAGKPANGPARAAPADPATALATALRASTHDDPANHVPSVALLKEFLIGRHTGPVDQAVVGVEITNRSKAGNAETRRCSGLLIRCDGFFLLPPGATSLSMSGGEEAVRQTVRVTVHPGTPQPQQALAYIRHYIVDGIDTTVMKLQDVHAPAARTLMPAALKPGDEVELAWTDWDATAGQFGPVHTRKAKLGSQLSGEEQKRLALRPGEIPFAELLEHVPPGAAVIGPEGMAVGVMPGSASRHDRFVSFALLDRVTNCVVAAPTTDDEFTRLQQADKQDGDAAAVDDANGTQPAGGARPDHHANDMVDIPGGPVRLPAAFLQDQRDMCAETIACVPAFKIDRYKVSNREYYDFWMSLPKSQRDKREVRAALYPVSWADADPPFPAEIDDSPVLGVTVAAAQAYAQSRGKRLPTTYEWSRAVFGVFGDAALPAWVNAYARDRQEAWNRIVTSHAQYYAATIPDLLRRQAERNADQIADQIDRAVGRHVEQPLPMLPHTIPFLDPREELGAACTWSAQTIEGEVKRLCEKWISPLYVLPAGSRSYDTSPFGLMDVLLNGNERVVYSPEPFPGLDTELGGRPHTVRFTLSGDVNAGSVFTPLSLSPIDVPFAVRDDGGEALSSPLLLSRRLVSSSSNVRPEFREFTPSDAERYTEYRERIYEDMLMALPITRARVSISRQETFANDSWGDGTITAFRGPDTKPVFGFVVRGFGIVQTWHPDADAILPPHHLGKRLSGGVGINAVGHFRYVPWRNGPINSQLTLQLPDTFRLGGTLAEPARPDEGIVLFAGVYFDEAWFYPAWEGVSPFIHREMGRDWAKDPPVHVGAWPVIGKPITQPPDIYLIPNGFRCAR
jgi:hypothetical protein